MRGAFDSNIIEPEKQTKARSNLAFTTCAAATVGLAILCIAMLAEQRSRIFEHVVSNNTNIVTALASEIEHAIELYDTSLRGVTDDLRSPQIKALDVGILRRVLFDHTLKNSYSGPLQVLDKNGTVILDSASATPTRANYSDQEFFRIHTDGKQHGLYVSVPITGKGGGYAIALSRPIIDDTGAFSGIAVGTIDLGYLNELFYALKLSPNSSITLFRTDGTVIMRKPFKVSDIGRKLVVKNIFDNFPSIRKGVFEKLSVIDGVKRIYTFSQVGDLPLILDLGVPTKEIYAGWYTQAVITGLLILAFFGAIFMSWLMVRRELCRRQEAERRLAELANTDSLTGLSNRRMFDELSTKEWLRAAREKRPISLLMIDADQFKVFNDSKGHQAGDRALQEIAHCVSRNLRRPADVGVRYGGEEFAVLLPNTGSDGALDVAEQIRLEISTTNSGDEITVSIGVSSLIPDGLLTVQDLIRGADEALYQAKREGRNRSCVKPIPSMVPPVLQDYPRSHSSVA